MGGNYANVGATGSEGGMVGNLGMANDGIAAAKLPPPNCYQVEEMVGYMTDLNHS